jgi:hypothetical protein
MMATRAYLPRDRPVSAAAMAAVMMVAAIVAFLLIELARTRPAY